MRFPRLLQIGGRVISVAALCGIAILPAMGCTASGTDSRTPSASDSPAPDQTSRLFTVTGSHPVAPNGSQDTATTTSARSCDGAMFTHDKNIGQDVIGGFSVSGLPVSADLLAHFLKGTDTGIDYPAASAISKKALASAEFKALNRQVQNLILGQLRSGKTHVQLLAAELQPITFESEQNDLYWGFRGTQGLTVTGSGRREQGRYVGTLTYVIKDSYGFPADDTLGGFGPPMRYLQTVCGAPEHPGGAHWFADAITVTVPFDQSA